MIIVRSPLRITLGGGGTDLASYYERHGGFVLAAAINKYVYVTLNEAFRPGIHLKYSKLEEVASIEHVEHPAIREALRLAEVNSIDLANLSDIPTGTGLGSSGSFVTALLAALHVFNKKFITKQELAEEAYRLEHDILQQHVGKQDQYIASIGGVTSFSIATDGVVKYEHLKMHPDTLANLEDGLLLFFTGYSHSASEILANQDIKSQENDSEILNGLHRTKNLGFKSAEALSTGDLHLFAELMHEHWLQKRAKIGMSNPHINDLYYHALTNGALGGKLVGAGGGGFLMFYTEDKARLRLAMRSTGLQEVRIRFDFEGTTVMHQ
jgi:D-glycero-alpha-D-manno-heptose-7-phosphate kinase